MDDCFEVIENELEVLTFLLFFAKSFQEYFEDTRWEKDLKILNLKGLNNRNLLLNLLGELGNAENVFNYLRRSPNNKPRAVEQVSFCLKSNERGKRRKLMGIKIKKKFQFVLFSTQNKPLVWVVVEFSHNFFFECLSCFGRHGVAKNIVVFVLFEIFSFHPG